MIPAITKKGVVVAVDVPFSHFALRVRGDQRRGCTPASRSEHSQGTWGQGEMQSCLCIVIPNIHQLLEYLPFVGNVGEPPVSLLLRLTR